MNNDKKQMARKRRCALELLKARNKYIREVERILKKNDVCCNVGNVEDDKLCRVVNNGTRFGKFVAEDFACTNISYKNIGYVSRWNLMTREEAKDCLAERGRSVAK